MNFLSLWLQGGKNEIFVDVIERLSVVIGSNVSKSLITFDIKLQIAYFTVITYLLHFILLLREF